LPLVRPSLGPNKIIVIGLSGSYWPDVTRSILFMVDNLWYSVFLAKRFYLLFKLFSLLLIFVSMQSNLNLVSYIACYLDNILYSKFYGSKNPRNIPYCEKIKKSTKFTFICFKIHKVYVYLFQNPQSLRLSVSKSIKFTFICFEIHKVYVYLFQNP